MIFLVEYDRRMGKTLSMIAFSDAERAHAADIRLARELELQRMGDDREVVLLQARSEAALRETHARYFMDLTQIANQLRGTSSSAVRERNDEED